MSDPPNMGPQVEKTASATPQKPIRKISLVTALNLFLTVLLALTLFFQGLNLASSIKLDHLPKASSHGLPTGKRSTGTEYLLGVGKADITGPVVEVGFMGYASLGQVGTGLRQRIYSRAFIIGDTQDTASRFIYLVLDTQSGDTAIRNGVLDALADLGSDYAMYTQQNVAVTGTHQHSGPGAWLNYLLPQITTLGFSKESYQAIVDGAVLSIKRAHQSLAPGYLTYGIANVAEGSVNRSPYAYLANPAAERANYSRDVETEITMLRFQNASNAVNIGVLTWFPVHGTSMLENNTHVTGDNKGVAAYLFEKSVLGEENAADGFVAGFAQSGVGDTSPNTLGAWCDDGSGEMCSFENSTCAGISETCHGRGPAFQALDLGVTSCFIIGQRQFEPAKDLYDNLDTAGTPIVGDSVKFFHFFNNMSNFTFPLANGTTVRTCPAALGYSFAAGTTDGPGAFDFTQNDSVSSDANPVWAVVSGLLKEPSQAQKDCQYPKPILLDVGEITAPYLWTPDIADVQSLRVGQFFIIVSPGEATTMSSRRWRKAVAAAGADSAYTDEEPIVVLGAPANSYTHYLATEEEYGIQRYEGASTLYGPHTLNAYINLTLSNLHYLAIDSTSQPATGPLPPDNRKTSLDFITPVVFDAKSLKSSYGDVVTNPNSSYSIGATVNASFIGANPRNNFRLEQTFAAVEQLTNNIWKQVRDDSDWSLIYTWYRDSTALGTSHVVISWETGADPVKVEAGTYRIRYYGDHKPLVGSIEAFTGTSGNFVLS